MGLSISTGFLARYAADREVARWFRGQVAIVNAVLTAHDLPPHVEPEAPGPPGPAVSRAVLGGFPYTFVHYLRRAFARVYEDLPLTPVPAGQDPGADPAIADAASTFDTHLLCHSDCEGFYVPVDFGDVLFDDTYGLPGGMLGSSVRLLAELCSVAPALGITLAGDALSDAEVGRLIADADTETGPYWRERLVWLELFEAARVSLANGCLVVFH